MPARSVRAQGQQRSPSSARSRYIVGASLFCCGTMTIRDQFVRQLRTFRIWCLVTSSVTVSMLVPAISELAATWSRDAG